MEEVIKKIFQNNAVQIAVIIGGVVITIINLYLASVISPLAEDIGSIIHRVDAIELRNEHVDPLAERFLITEERTNQTAQDIQEIKNQLIRVDEKIDLLLDQ